MSTKRVIAALSVVGLLILGFVFFRSEAPQKEYDPTEPRTDGQPFMLRPGDKLPAPRAEAPPAVVPGAPAPTSPMGSLIHPQQEYEGDFNRPPPGGVPRLEWMRRNHGATIGGLGLIALQIEGLSKEQNLPPEGVAILARLKAEYDKLEQKQREQAKEIAAFDVNAPPKYGDYTPMPIANALSNRAEDWNTLLARSELKPLDGTQEKRLQDLVAQAEKRLSGTVFPAQDTPFVRDQFFRVVEALTHQEPEAKELLALRMDQFVDSVKQISNPPKAQ